MSRRPTMIEFNASDRKMLEEIADHCGVSLATVARWSLRFFAVKGPWCIGSPGKREEVLSETHRLEIGPNLMETR